MRRGGEESVHEGTIWKHFAIFFTLYGSSREIVSSTSKMRLNVYILKRKLPLCDFRHKIYQFV